MKTLENLRILAAEIVEKAKSGHPGAPMGLAQFIYILYTENLVLDPLNSRYPCRGIFILSNGHACMGQYIMNHLMGFLSIEDLKSFRTINSNTNSNTPGHPERNNLGIEISTEPLGEDVCSECWICCQFKDASRKRA